MSPVPFVLVLSPQGGTRTRPNMHPAQVHPVIPSVRVRIGVRVPPFESRRRGNPSPNGASYESPGHRPGNRIDTPPQSPERANQSHQHPSPRCWHALSGLIPGLGLPRGDAPGCLRTPRWGLLPIRFIPFRQLGLILSTPSSSPGIGKLRAARCHQLSSIGPVLRASSRYSTSLLICPTDRSDLIDPFAKTAVP